MNDGSATVVNTKIVGGNSGTDLRDWVHSAANAQIVLSGTS